MCLWGTNLHPQAHALVQLGPEVAAYTAAAPHGAPSQGARRRAGNARRAQAVVAVAANKADLALPLAQAPVRRAGEPRSRRQAVAVAEHATQYRRALRDREDQLPRELLLAIVACPHRERVVQKTSGILVAPDGVHLRARPLHVPVGGDRLGLAAAIQLPGPAHGPQGRPQRRLATARLPHAAPGSGEGALPQAPRAATPP
eukprot:CAMPEP_0179120394 /NCGR_PEP_ID=MMETSP0796-20121207/56722_1 /TAXON_ID=73915 /ORGANISM="Pyrodinium bahamense, Strain pbaha01" /LENGTH=200 /DNA_ID=CAMNT_0020818933 /DNA_START=110 /DNA_END=711 /DNA_ORIENTATION=+